MVGGLQRNKNEYKAVIKKKLSSSSNSNHEPLNDVMIKHWYKTYKYMHKEKLKRNTFTTSY